MTQVIGAGAGPPYACGDKHKASSTTSTMGRITGHATPGIGWGEANGSTSGEAVPQVARGGAESGGKDLVRKLETSVEKEFGIPLAGIVELNLPY